MKCLGQDENGFWHSYALNWYTEGWSHLDCQRRPLFHTLPKEGSQLASVCELWSKLAPTLFGGSFFSFSCSSIKRKWGHFSSIPGFAGFWSFFLMNITWHEYHNIDTIKTDLDYDQTQICLYLLLQYFQAIWHYYLHYDLLLRLYGIEPTEYRRLMQVMWQEPIKHHSKWKFPIMS